MATKSDLKFIKKQINELLPDINGNIVYRFINIVDGGDEIIINRYIQKEVIEYLGSIGEINITKICDDYAIFQTNDYIQATTIPIPVRKQKKHSQIKIHKDRISCQNSEYEPNDKEISIITKAIHNKLKKNKDVAIPIDEFVQYINGLSQITISKERLITGLQSIQKSLNNKKMPLKLSIKIKNNYIRIYKI